MCAALELNSRVLRPGKLLAAWKNIGAPCRFVWAGFARRETLGWWKKQGWVPVDVPAHRFAERSNVTGKLVWEPVPIGSIVRGLFGTEGASPLIKVVTRAANAAELVRFEHPRMPLIEIPLYSADPIIPSDETPESERPIQGELF